MRRSCSPPFVPAPSAIKLETMRSSARQQRQQRQKLLPSLLLLFVSSSSSFAAAQGTTTNTATNTTTTTTTTASSPWRPTPLRASAPTASLSPNASTISIQLRYKTWDGNFLDVVELAAGVNDRG